MTPVPSCQCRECRLACTNKPGWFQPGEAERAAKLTGMSLPNFFKRFLQVDWWCADSKVDHDVFVLSPAVVNGQPGEMFAGNPRGTCVFYKDGQCSIHAAKPFECRDAYHTDADKKIETRKVGITKKWDKQLHQKQIKKLLGRAPRSNGDWSLLDELRAVL